MGCKQSHTSELIGLSKKSTECEQELGVLLDELVNNRIQKNNILNEIDKIRIMNVYLKNKLK
jgi:hypothetical protein